MTLTVCSRIQDKAAEQESALEEEIDDRNCFQTEAECTVAWLAETKQELNAIHPGKEVSDVMETMEKQKVNKWCSHHGYFEHFILKFILSTLSNCNGLFIHYFVVEKVVKKNLSHRKVAKR